MKLRNHSSFITSLPEGTPPTNIRPRITQAIYYAILLSIVGYIFYILSTKYFYFNEAGVVEVEKTILSASRGGKVLKLTVKEGHAFKNKNLLATLSASKSCGASTTNSARINKLKFDLGLKRSKLSLLNREIKLLQNNLSTFNLQRALETGQARDASLSKLKNTLLKKQNDASLLNGEIILLKKYIKNPGSSYYANGSSLECFNESIYSPFKGVVHSIKRKLNEFSPRGEALLLLIADDAPVHIEVYLENDQLSYLQLNALLTVTFANGSETKAEIKKIHSSAFSSPEREWNHYKPSSTQIRVHLSPLNKDDAMLWKKYDRMPVNVRGAK